MGLSFDVGIQGFQMLDAAIESDYWQKAGFTSKSPSETFSTRSLSGRQVTRYTFGDAISPKISPSKKPPSSC
jgi:hypothetical protein